MDPNVNRFNQRVTRIERATSGHLPGHVHVRADGLIVQKRAIWRPSIPWHSIMLAVLCCFLLKSAMIWHQGPQEYAARLAILSDGTTGHQIAARVLSMDTVSSWLAAQFTAILGAPPR